MMIGQARDKEAILEKGVKKMIIQRKGRKNYFSRHLYWFMH
jgi:hypothetical protein